MSWLKIMLAVQEMISEAKAQVRVVRPNHMPRCEVENGSISKGKLAPVGWETISAVLFTWTTPEASIPSVTIWL